MRKTRLKEEQIIRILRDAEAGRLTAAAVRRKHGIREQTFYRWTQKPAQLLATALETADANAANAPLAVAATRRGVRELLALPLAEAYRRQEEIGGPPRRSEDAREAQRAFLEKRRPVWKGR